MNKVLKSIMVRYDVTQAMLAEYLNISRKTVCTKINDGTFTQIELIKILEYFRKYDKSLGANFLLEEKLHVNA